MSDLQVDIWADIICPWCAIGTTQFFKAVESLRGDIDVIARYMPFELYPDMPDEGEDHSELLAQTYAVSVEEAADMRAKVEAAAEEAGFSMAYASAGEAPARRVWNTHGAHKLLRWALTAGTPDTQVRLAQALFAAHFQQRRNISAPDILLAIAEEQGFDTEQAAAALEEEALTIAVKLEQKRALENHITSVPTIVVNGRYILQGSQEAEKFASALVQIASMEAAA